MAVRTYVRTYLPTYIRTYIHTYIRTYTHTYIHTYIIVTGHGKLKTYLHKYKIIENPQCICNKGEQTVDHIIYSCDLHERERDKLVAVITRTEQWPVSKPKMMLKYYKDFKQFTDSIVLNEG